MDPVKLPMVLLVHGGPWARDHWYVLERERERERDREREEKGEPPSI
jgi:hypothetical protein